MIPCSKCQSGDVKFIVHKVRNTTFVLLACESCQHYGIVSKGKTRTSAILSAIGVGISQALKCFTAFIWIWLLIFAWSFAEGK